MTNITIMGKIDYNRDNSQEPFQFLDFEISSVSEITLQKEKILQTIIHSSHVQQVLNGPQCHIMFCGELENDNFKILALDLLQIDPYPEDRNFTFNF